jgi:hypothetical protein
MAKSKIQCRRREIWESLGALLSNDVHTKNIEIRKNAAASYQVTGLQNDDSEGSRGGDCLRVCELERP